MTDTKPPKIHAAPGIYLVELIEEKSKVNYGEPKNKPMLKGKILDVGEDRTHDAGGELRATLGVGDIIWFFSYVEGGDWFEEDKKRYYTVIFNDVRSYTEK